jgi:hypothetical protein
VDERRRLLAPPLLLCDILQEDSVVNPAPLSLRRRYLAIIIILGGGVPVAKNSSIAKLVLGKSGKWGILRFSANYRKLTYLLTVDN